MIEAARVAPLLRGFGAVAPLAVPQLNVADHGDNSGATATIEGAALGSTNEVLVQTFQGDFGSGMPASGGSVIQNASTPSAIPRMPAFLQVTSRRPTER